MWWGCLHYSKLLMRVPYTLTYIGKHRQTQTDRDRQEPTGTRRDRQGRTLTDREKEGQISRGKNRDKSSRD